MEGTTVILLFSVYEFGQYRENILDMRPSGQPNSLTLLKIHTFTECVRSEMFCDRK